MVRPDEDENQSITQLHEQFNVLRNAQISSLTPQAWTFHEESTCTLGEHYLNPEELQLRDGLVLTGSDKLCECSVCCYASFFIHQSISSSPYPKCRHFFRHISFISD